MDFFLVEKIAVRRLQQRCLDWSDAHWLFRIDRDSGVLVSRPEWRAIGDHFRQSIRSSAWVLRWSLILQIPVGLLILSLGTSSSYLLRIWDAIDGVVPGLGWLVLSTALPVAGLVWHMRSVNHAIAVIIGELAKRPRQPIPPRAVRRGLHAIEIVALVLFGPGTFISLYGSLVPHAFDNTPWMGRGMDWSSAIGLAAFAVIVGRQLLLRWGARPAPDARQSPAPTTPRRRALVAHSDD